MEELAHEVLPPGIGFEWTELAFQQQLPGTSSLLVFGAAALFVFLVLAAQYESWNLPLAVVMIVPMCLLASVTGLLIRGMPIDVLAQIGFVVLVGLAAKNAILIVEFARQTEENGATPGEAAVTAARTRLRPILMTSLAFIFGVCAAGGRDRRRLGDAAIAGHGRIRRHAGRDRLRPAVHAGLLHHRAQDRSQEATHGSPRGRTRSLSSSTGPGPAVEKLRSLQMECERELFPLAQEDGIAVIPI